MGSVTLACNAVTGGCDCKPGVVGHQCDRCADGYWQLSPSGCAPCDCNMLTGGATGLVCDKQTGQCPCKVTRLLTLFQSLQLITNDS